MKKQGKKFAFLGLNAADTPEGARAFLKRYGWKWPSIVDPRRKRALKFGADYQPAVILVDATGHFVGGFQGAGTPARWNELKAELKKR